jgi:hypothetical protein
MRFKTPELEEEFKRAHPKVIALARYLDWWFMQNVGHDGMLTDVERTQEEYDKIYNASPYLGPRPHLAPQSRAVDWRSIEFTEDDILKACEHMNHWWPRRDNKPTLMYHSVGGGAKHFHLQAEV